MNETNDTDKLAFQPFQKLARLNREIVITEKIDGTNAQILITEPPADYDIDDPVNEGVWLRNGLLIRAGSRNQWISPRKDNYGFAGWVLQNADELVELGPGRHFGEWWGNGIQRGYGLKEKRFSLFSVGRWHPDTLRGGIFQLVKDEATGAFSSVAGPACCHTVPILWRGLFSEEQIRGEIRQLDTFGSRAAPGFMDAEGVVIYHMAADTCFKVTLKNDESPKSVVKNPAPQFNQVAQ